eukprot:CAMPEP_0194208686 /NCGR_PEP_ID=MMETSP0156-20130528/7073_1 /TAXON_ID=33649 /ORGANISM="Thalassionema nitzschioides, Strain L26-B" /LENGTH=556 /DNA_ID=CAMNT_0038935709 /DNA_START=85 /DNA_END=1752 /DNA_ORIENTATION=-
MFVKRALLFLSFFASRIVAETGGKCDYTDDTHEDRIMSLPGWDQPLPSAWYSGYLDYDFNGQEVHTHYILVQAETMSNDGDSSLDSKPLIYWSNGGPGASSIFGLMTELGPLILSDDSLKTDSYRRTGIPSLMYNPYSWTRLGSLLIFDQPAPVGFSYCKNETGFDKENGHDDVNCGKIGWTDELASANAYLALEQFYERHPCLQSKDLYLTGESYAGIYVPTLARRILETQDTSLSATTKMNLQGIAVGDGCLGTETSICGNLNSVGFGDYWNVLFLAGHHQIPLEDYQNVMNACHHVKEKDFLIANSSDDDACRKALEKVKTEVGGYFEYSLYDDCTYRNGLFSTHVQNHNGRGGDNSIHAQIVNDGGSFACGGGVVLESYVKLDSVRQALRVKSDFFETDNAQDGFNYTPTEPDLTGFYQYVIHGRKIRVLIYNGDTDPAITSFASQNWTSHLGFEEIQHWRPWTLDNCKRMGGYVTRYEGGFDFLTIRGAGHMVPTYKPAATFAFMKTWINNKDDYPEFDATCTSPPEIEQVFDDDADEAMAPLLLKRLLSW